MMASASPTPSEDNHRNQRDDPTPSEDNHRNQRDDTMYSALDTVMNKSEQTYDDFINNFTFLKTGDLNRETSTARSAVKAPFTISTGTSTNSAIHREIPVKSGSPTEQKPDMEEEMLCAGDKTSRMSGSKVIRTGALVKFDNYVEAEEDIDDIDVLDDDLPSGGYTASFIQGAIVGGSSRPNTTVPLSTECLTTSDQDVLPELVNTQLSLDESSTDKLLMNFLADLQNEENEGRAVIDSRTASSDASLDIEKFLKSRKTQKKVTKLEQKPEIEQETDEVTFDDDETDAALSLFEDSINSQIKVVLKAEELDKISKSDGLEEEKRSSKLNIYKNVLMDSEGVIQTVAAERIGIDEVLSNKVEEGDILFPGEAESTAETERIKNERTLDFTATYRTTTTPSIDDTNEVECSNSVEPFQLDEDFDYDNVVLTPKFSLEDMERLRPLLNAQAIVM